MQLLDGKKLSEEIKLEIAEEVKNIRRSAGKTPHLAAILVGDDGASQTYVASKIKNCEAVGIRSTLVRLKSDITENELLAQIHMLNNDDDIDGFIVQLPLPKHINETKVVLSIAPEKDVDGFHPANLGRMALNLPCYIPATPKGILEMLKRYKVVTSGKHCVVVGRSAIVGLPMSILMGRKSDPGNCTVTLCHSGTKDLKEMIQQADIIIAALGKPKFITADMVKQNAVVIDVGITRIPDTGKKSGYRIVGDVDFENVAPKCSYITPVPGGVGLMTVISLLQNTLLACKGDIYEKSNNLDIDLEI
jgi:methylenetetrahydrofolate dehydrogenase (NADP+) / methenyltetrahydrofolate cyclohydrolase